MHARQNDKSNINAILDLIQFPQVIHFVWRQRYNCNSKQSSSHHQTNGLHNVHVNTRLSWFIFSIITAASIYYMPWMQRENMTMKEVVLYPMARCCCGVSEYTQVLTLNHPHQKGQQHASISADSVSQLLLLHHQWHWCLGFCFILSRLIIKQLYIFFFKNQHEALCRLCKQLLIMKRHIKSSPPI